MTKFLPYTFLLVALALQTAQAQTTCRDYECLVRLGDSLAVAGDYVGAIRHYNAAKLSVPDSTGVMNRRIEARFNSIDNLRAEAEEAEKKFREEEEQAARNLERANRAEKEAKNQADRARANAGQALREMEISDSLSQVADAQRQRAVDETLRLEDETRLAEETLRKLSQAFGELTDIYCKQADEHILRLRYDLALNRAAEASELGERSRTDRMKGLYLELAYYYNEAGLADTAAMMTDSLQVWADTTRKYPATPMLSRDSLRLLLLETDSLGFMELEKRYYPYMITVQGGTFRMGSEKLDKKSLRELRELLSYSRREAAQFLKDEMPAHDVTISDFTMAQSETTWWQYALYCRAEGMESPSSPSWGIEGNHPVVNVSWEDAQGYIQWLNGRSSKTYRLPTEAEWEYAAGNGSLHTTYSWGNDLPDGKQGGNVADETAKKQNPGWMIFEGYTDGFVNTAPVGSFNPNQLGLFDMTGNVWEWCADWYGDYTSGPQKDPKGPLEGSNRVFRGGSWSYTPRYCRVSYRLYYDPAFRGNAVGFRLARSL